MKQDHFLFPPDFFPSLLSPEHVAWLCCHWHGDNSWANSLAALSRSSSCLAVPSAGRHNRLFHPQGAALTHLDFWSGLHPLLASTQHLDVTHLSFPQLPPCPAFPSHGGPGADQSCKCCPITQTLVTQVPSARPESPHASVCSWSRDGKAAWMVTLLLSCSWPKCTHATAKEGRTAGKPG